MASCGGISTAAVPIGRQTLPGARHEPNKVHPAPVPPVRNTQECQRAAAMKSLVAGAALLFLAVVHDIRTVHSHPTPNCGKFQSPYCSYDCGMFDCYENQTAHVRNRWESCMNTFKNDSGNYLKNGIITESCTKNTTAWQCVCDRPLIARIWSIYGSTTYVCLDKLNCDNHVRDYPVCFQNKQKLRTCRNPYNCEEIKCSQYKSDGNAAQKWEVCSEKYKLYSRNGGVEVESIGEYNPEAQDCMTDKISWDVTSECKCYDPFIINDLNATYIREFGPCINKVDCMKTTDAMFTFNPFIQSIDMKHPNFSIKKCIRRYTEFSYCNYNCGLPFMDCKTYHSNRNSTQAKDFDKCLAQYKTMSIEGNPFYYRNEDELRDCLYKNGSDPRVKWSNCLCRTINLRSNAYKEGAERGVTCERKSNYDRCGFYGPRPPTTTRSPTTRFMFDGHLAVPPVDKSTPHDYRQSLDPNDPSWKSPDPITSDFYDFLDYLREQEP